MWQVGELEEPVGDVGKPVPIETENLEGSGQVLKATQLQHRYPVVVQVPIRVSNIQFSFQIKANGLSPKQIKQNLLALLEEKCRCSCLMQVINEVTNSNIE